MPSLCQLYAQPPKTKDLHWTEEIADKFITETSPDSLATNRQRLLTCLLHSDALWPPESESNFDNFNRYFSWRSGHDPVTEHLLKYFHLRFNAIDPHIHDDTFKRRLSYGRDSAKYIIASADPSTDFIKLLVNTWGLSRKFLEYVIRDPNPDFIRCNQHFGWLGPMTDPDVLLDRGRAMLREQMVTVYEFHPDNLNGSANPGGRRSNTSKQ